MVVIFDKDYLRELYETGKGDKIPAYMLLRLQTDYDMVITKRDKSFIDRLASVRHIVAAL